MGRLKIRDKYGCLVKRRGKEVAGAQAYTLAEPYGFIGGALCGGLLEHPDGQRRRNFDRLALALE